MVNMFLEDPKLLERLKIDPIKVLKEIAPKAEKAVDKPGYWSDRWFYYIVVSVLGIIAIVAAVSSVVLVLGDRTTPEVLVAMGAAAIGALAGIFAPSPSSK